MMQTSAALIGRFLLGFFFLVPGVMKLVSYDGTLAYMTSHDIVQADYVGYLLIAASVVEIVAGTALIVGFFSRFAAVTLFAFTIVVNVFLHDFWTLSEPALQLELQLFFKNLGIMGGLAMIMALGAGPVSVDSRLAGGRLAAQE